jgi:hypothetical protein
MPSPSHPTIDVIGTADADATTDISWTTVSERAGTNTDARATLPPAGTNTDVPTVAETTAPNRCAPIPAAHGAAAEPTAPEARHAASAAAGKPAATATLSGGSIIHNDGSCQQRRSAQPQKLLHRTPPYKGDRVARESLRFLDK